MGLEIDKTAAANASSASLLSDSPSIQREEAADTGVFVQAWGDIALNGESEASNKGAKTAQEQRKEAELLLKTQKEQAKELAEIYNLKCNKILPLIKQSGYDYALSFCQTKYLEAREAKKALKLEKQNEYDAKLLVDIYSCKYKEALSLVKQSGYSNASKIMRERKEAEHNRMLEKKDGLWNPNIRVIASSSQYDMTHNIKIDGEPRDIYLMDLFRNYWDTNTIEEAHHELVANGIGASEQETDTEQLKIFDKRDHTKNRFVVLVTQNFTNKPPKGLASGQDLIKSSEKVKEELVYYCKVPQDSIVKKQADGYADFEAAIDEVLEKIKKVDDPNSVELMVVYNGHGNYKRKIPILESIKTQGEETGLIMDMEEKQLKEMLNRKLGNIPTLVMMNACYSGSWVK